jgi:hypothetical protein
MPVTSLAARLPSHSIGTAVLQISISARDTQFPLQMPDIRLQAISKTVRTIDHSLLAGGVHIRLLGMLYLTGKQYLRHKLRRLLGNANFTEPAMTVSVRENRPSHLVRNWLTVSYAQVVLTEMLDEIVVSPVPCIKHDPLSEERMTLGHDRADPTSQNSPKGP